jgi:hypothetical protein
MRIRALPLLLVALAACTKATEPPATLQSFALLDIDADPLPALAGPEGTSTIYPYDETIALREDGTARIILDFVEVLGNGSAMPERTRRETFLYTIFGDSIRVMTTAGCVIDVCTIARGTLIGGDMTLIRPQWSGTNIFNYDLVPAP